MSKSNDIKTATAPTIQELQRIVQENEERVKAQRKRIEGKIRELENDLQQPTTVRTEELNSFDLQDIENNTRPSDSREAIVIKINALRRALEYPLCYDKQFLQSLQDYLKAIHPVVEQLEQQQYEKIQLAKQKQADAEQYCSEQMQSYAEADQQIESMLRIAHLTHLGREYEKRIPMNGLWGITTSLMVKDLIDHAAACEDGDAYKAVSRYWDA